MIPQLTASFLWWLLKQTFALLLFSLLRKQFVAEVIVIMLRWFAERTDNDLDDQLVDVLDRALQAKLKPGPNLKPVS